ncbi:hypothetical protein [Cupriavidus pauculus]|nr:hypothetical protein [Cupriavidus pauculus]
MDRHFIALAALKALADDGTVPQSIVAQAIQRYGVAEVKVDPSFG